MNNWPNNELKTYRPYKLKVDLIRVNLFNKAEEKDEPNIGKTLI